MPKYLITAYATLRYERIVEADSKAEAERLGEAIDWSEDDVASSAFDKDEVLVLRMPNTPTTEEKR